nr:MAG TPA: hypothetical protein [Caudoviricetes sp.]
MRSSSTSSRNCLKSSSGSPALVLFKTGRVVLPLV